MTDDELIRKNKRTGLIVLVVLFVMVGLSFASVPLYNLFCRTTGFGGTTQVATQLPDKSEIIDRVITIRFDANKARDLPWDFKPEIVSMKVKLGERGFANFISRNKSDQAVTGMAIYNVTPLKVGKYFHKIQCFCFDQQTLQANQSVNMPVLFFVDPKMNEDKSMDDVKTITLSYSFFKAESKKLDKAVDDYYEDKPLTY